MSTKITPKVAVSIVYVIAMFMTIMDITIVNVALPAIGKDLNSDQLDQVSISFLIALSIFIPASGWIGDRLGNRRAFLLALTVFTVASALCGVATSFNQLVAFRFLQGIGGGLLTPIGMTMLMRVFPPEERIRASAVLIPPSAIAPATGPLLGGFLVDHASWHWVFLVNIPIGVAALIFGYFFVADPGGHPPGTFDLPGFLLAGTGLALTMYGISEGPERGWSDGVVLSTIAVGLALLVALVKVEARADQPLVNLKLLRIPLFRTSVIIIVAFYIALFGTVFIISIYLQQGLGYSAQQTGLTTFTQAVGAMIGAQLVTKYLHQRLGTRQLCTIALVLLTVVVASLVSVEPGVSLWWLRLQLLGIGIGLGVLFVPLQVAAFADVSLRQTGQASSMYNAGRQLGGAIGIAAVYTIVTGIGFFTETPTGPVVHVAAVRWAFIACALVLASMIPLAMRIQDPVPATPAEKSERETVVVAD